MLAAIAIVAVLMLIGEYGLTKAAPPPCALGPNVCPATTTPSASATTPPGSSPGGGLATGSTAAPPPGGGGIVANQLSAALLTAADLGAFQSTGTSTTGSGVLCGVDVHTLAQAVESSYAVQAEAGFVGASPDTSRQTIRIVLAAFDTPASASLFLQDAAVRLGAAARLEGDLLVIAGQASGDICVLGEEEALVVAVQATGADSQTDTQQAESVMALQRQRVRTLLEGATPAPSASAAATATPAPTPNAATTPASNSVAGSDEDPPQPTL